MTALVIPPRNLLEDLRVTADTELDVEACEATPAQARMYVGAFMLTGPSPTPDERRAALLRVREFYLGCGRPELLDEPPFPSVEKCVAEMLWLVRNPETTETDD